jgi:uncharacterized protein YdcH (DUF465 family)
MSLRLLLRERTRRGDFKKLKCNKNIMLGEKHDLIYEFPEYRERINELKATNAEFAEKFAQYHELEHEIHRIEVADEAHSDFYMEDLKKRRLLLKDELYDMLRQGGETDV